MKRIVSLILVAFIISFLPARLAAQGCSVCTKTASELGGKAARGLNGGILYLAFLPLAILGTVGVIWWRNGK